MAAVADGGRTNAIDRLRRQKGPRQWETTTPPTIWPDAEDSSTGRALWAAWSRTSPAATYRKRNPASAQIVADWEIIVGPKIASMTVPRRLERGVLTIACAGPAAMDLHYMGVEVINRINTHLGGQPVHSLKFTQAGMPREAAARTTLAPRSGPGSRGSGDQPPRR